MRRTIIGLAAAGAMAAGMATVPSQAHAVAPWVIPAIVAASIVGGVVGAAAVQAGQAYAGDCRVVTVKAPDGTFQKVEVCNR